MAQPLSIHSHWHYFHNNFVSVATAIIYLCLPFSVETFFFHNHAGSNIVIVIVFGWSSVAVDDQYDSQQFDIGSGQFVFGRTN